jgi:hypothetical protein
MDLATVALMVQVVMMALLAYLGYRRVREARQFGRFIRDHGFRRLTPSTMWLARVIEHASALHVEGYWDGLPVSIRRHRRGMTIVVTADADLVPAAAGNVSIGPWTKPGPPPLLHSGLVASGRELRLHWGDTPDPAPIVAAAVAYAQMLARQPVDSPPSLEERNQSRIVL